jgi:hypothetical protein
VVARLRSLDLDLGHCGDGYPSIGEHSRDSLCHHDGELFGGHPREPIHLMFTHRPSLTAPVDTILWFRQGCISTIALKV